MLVGCAAEIVVVPPRTLTAAPDFHVAGRIVYDGDGEYLPRTLAEAPGPSTLALRYTYTVTYGGTTGTAPPPSFPAPPASGSGHPVLEAASRFDRAVSHGAAVAAVAALVVMPTGKDEIAVTGRLEILKGDEVVQTYTATAELKKTRRLLSEGETLSALRRRGLLAVRESIEAQMAEDRDALLRLAGSD